MSNIHIPILILAAGASKRMLGQDKLMMEVYDMPLLRHVTIQAIATKNPVTVILSDKFPERHQALNGLHCGRINVENPIIEMSQSLVTGIKNMPQNTPALLVALADMPEVTTQSYLTLIDKFSSDPDEPIVRACSETGQAGNPVVLPRWALKLLEDETGDQGARGLIQKYKDRVKTVPLPDQHAVLDLDTPDDWARWRAGKR